MLKSIIRISLASILLCVSYPLLTLANVQEVEGLVRVSDVDPSIIIDLRYAQDANFTKKVIYPVNVAVIRKETAEKLAQANMELQKGGYHLKIWDAYRPPYVQKIFWNLVPDDRYVANPYKGGSRHNRGGAVDVTLVDQKGNEVEMPSGFDDFSSRAWPNNFALNAKVRKNVDLLRKVMMAHGFLPIEHEWWHFDDAHWQSFPLVNVLLERFLDPPSVLKDVPEGSNEALIVDAGPGFKGKMTVWEKQGGQWRAVFSSMDVVVGKNGIAKRDQKREGDGKTPTGMFPLRTAFGYSGSLDTKLYYKQVSSEDIWVDDINSSHYNQWINIKNKGDAQSFERMKREDDLYEAGAIIEYNTQPIKAGLGSAIFLHIWRGPSQPTAGCVALSKENILKVLKWLDLADKPVIVINQK